ncbi:MAG TPA: MATE family efflux transporter, partial [Acidimicrobiia bacterium]|nr:MATE family efflux transporter [Acidimicrobiia bacterium]
FNFLAYATTATVARRVGAGDARGAAAHGVAGLWLALGLGIALMLFGLAVSGPAVNLMGASENVAPFARTYLRISLLGAPFVLVALAGTGYLRGLQDTRTPLFIALGANALNLGLELALVYGFDLGIAGSAWGTVVAQCGAALVYVFILDRKGRRAGATRRPERRQLRQAAVIGAQLTVRTGTLLIVFTTASAIAARLGDIEIAAHQIAWQLWWFAALSLDAIAIAGQAIVGRSLGASDATGARRASRRMIQWGIGIGAVFGLVIIAAEPLFAVAFTNDDAVRDLLFGVLLSVGIMQPLAGAVFVLDGILIGAGDSRYLAIAMTLAMLSFLPFAIIVAVTNAPLVALWGALYVFMVARLYGLGRRYRRDQWLVTGALAT